MPKCGTAPWNRERNRLTFGAMKTETSSDPSVHSQNVQRRLDELIHHTREDVERVQEPRFQALLETTAEVLTGLKKAYQDYDKKNEKAWRG